jgi:hypothetical protein
VKEKLSTHVGVRVDELEDGTVLIHSMSVKDGVDGLVGRRGRARGAHICNVKKLNNERVAHYSYTHSDKSTLTGGDHCPKGSTENNYPASNANHDEHREHEVRHYPLEAKP